MKIDINQIFLDYIKTLRGPNWTFASIIDFATIFGIPLLAAYSCYFFQRDLGRDLFLSLFTLFGVFIAVFMAIQGVLIPLYDSKRQTSVDPVVDERLQIEAALKRKIIKEVSLTLSYMKLFSLISMSILLIPISTGSELFLFQWISVLLATHLILNLLVILKRMHALFSHQFS